MPGKQLCPSWGSPALSPGGPSGQLVLRVSWPSWQQVLSSSGASPTLIPARVDSRGHILARAPCQPLAPAHCLLSPASSVEPTQLPPCHSHPCPSCVGTASPSFWGCGCWVLGPSGPSRSKILDPAAEPDSGTPSGAHRLAGTGVTPKGGSCLSEPAGVWHSTALSVAQHGTAWSVAQHTERGTEHCSTAGYKCLAWHSTPQLAQRPCPPLPSSALARAESMTRRGI